MQEFIEKLIDRLEEQQEKYEHGGYDDYLDGKYDAVSKDIEIINKLAEEYKYCTKSCTDCEAYDLVKHNCPKFCKIIKETVEEIKEEYKGKDCSQCSRRKFYQQGYEDAMKNNGWIPCSERLPEDTENYFVTWKDRATCKEYVEITEYDAVSQEWLDCICQAGLLGYDIIAWMPLPAPYKEGE